MFDSEIHDTMSETRPSTIRILPNKWLILSQTLREKRQTGNRPSNDPCIRQESLPDPTMTTIDTMVDGGMEEPHNVSSQRLHTSDGEGFKNLEHDHGTGTKSDSNNNNLTGWLENISNHL